MRLKHIIKISSHKPDFSDEAARIETLTDWLMAHDIEYDIEISHALTGSQYIFWSYDITIDFMNDEHHALFLLSFAHEF